MAAGLELSREMKTRAPGGPWKSPEGAELPRSTTTLRTTWLAKRHHLAAMQQGRQRRALPASKMSGSGPKWQDRLRTEQLSDLEHRHPTLPHHSHRLERGSNLDTPVAINEEARRYRRESPHEAAIAYARLDVDVVVGGFEKRHDNFMPRVRPHLGERSAAVQARQRCRPAASPPRRGFPATTDRAIVLLSFRPPCGDRFSRAAKAPQRPARSGGPAPSIRHRPECRREGVPRRVSTADRRPPSPAAPDRPGAWP